METSKKYNLLQDFKYSEDSIVSNSLVAKDKGTITFFAFDQGEGLSEHSAPFDALVHILEGEMTVKISGKAHKLIENEMILMPANAPHSLKAEKKSRMLLTMIKCN